MLSDKLIDVLQFREGTEEEADGSIQPIITTGSIVWGVLLRTAIIVFLSFIFYQFFGMQKFWWFTLLLIWFVSAYPAYRQYQIFQHRIQKVQEETLCGKCKYFESSSQLCRLYDEHISKNYIPCEGLSWEPTTVDENDID
jgi:hypothetical protein